MTHRRWSVLSIVVSAAVGVLAGIASGLFLEALHAIAQLRIERPWLLFGLPAGGAIVVLLYANYGSRAAGGTNLILDELHLEPAAGVPFRMLPLILMTTLLTHLFGGSAGREGTAVQMGGAIAAEASRRLGLDTTQRRLVILCGIAGGFSGVFGTPLAATIFAVEVPAIGRLRLSAIGHCFIAAIVAHATVTLLSVEHAHYVISATFPAVSAMLIAKIMLAGAAFGLAAALFIELTRAVERTSHRVIANPVTRASLGGAAIVMVTLALGTRAYNGLSLPLLEQTLAGVDVPNFAFLAKLGLTALTLGVGFKGGEVTPLFVIGATLGATLSGPMSLPSDALAAIGFVSVFAAAANTPLACLVMAMELFGGHGAIYFALSIAVAYLVSGHRGIYAAQHPHRTKFGFKVEAGGALPPDAPPLGLQGALKQLLKSRSVRWQRTRSRADQKTRSPWYDR